MLFSLNFLCGFRFRRGVSAILFWLAICPGVVLADSVPTDSVPTNSSPVNHANGQVRDDRKQEKNGDVSSSPDMAPLIGIIVDDLGYRRREGLRALELPGNPSFSVIPNAPHGRELADAAHALGREVLLHIPMESTDNRELGPGGLTKEMTRIELTESVCASIREIPYARGLSNHMGSLLTRRKRPMRWLMEAMLECGPQEDIGLYFVDSHTTGGTVAAATAREYNIPTLERDIFLDHDPNADVILTRLRQLVRKAKKRGTALGLAHPYPETLDVLNRVLPQLESWGVTLVPVSALLASRR